MAWAGFSCYWLLNGYLLLWERQNITQSLTEPERIILPFVVNVRLPRKIDNTNKKGESFILSTILRVNDCRLNDLYMISFPVPELFLYLYNGCLIGFNWFLRQQLCHCLSVNSTLKWSFLKKKTMKTVSCLCQENHAKFWYFNKCWKTWLFMLRSGIWHLIKPAS